MNTKLSLEERVLVLEWMLDAALWGPHLHNPVHLRAVAAQLYMQLERAEQLQALPAAVLHALYQRADGLAALDNTPDALRPALRQAVLPVDPHAGNPTAL
nr:hypothetical protein [uncultured Comamonas sp.]